MGRLSRHTLVWLIALLSACSPSGGTSTRDANVDLRGSVDTRPADGRLDVPATSSPDARVADVPADRVEPVLDSAPGRDTRDANGTDGGEAGLSCTPQFTTCTGLCGSVLDLCSGVTLECGECAKGLACDQSVHRCVTPKVVCADLGAECGRIRNSCGTVLDCGTCPTGQECNPDTNRCVACTLPTETAAACSAMGMACGKVWLGCGATTQMTDCGGCAAGRVCNDAFNTCELQPVSAGGTCTPMTKAQACAGMGNQCGFVTDGCGKTVNCGDCPTGQECATGGVANRCNKPPRPAVCIAEGRECGTTIDACKSSVDCGSCSAGYKCSDAGKCEKVCVPKVCDDLKGPPRVCGWKVPDQCGGFLNCFDCWKDGADCADPDNDGQGLCCTPPTALPAGWECGRVTSDCGASKDFTCPNGKGCGPDHKCCDLPTKSALNGADCGTATNTCGTKEFGCTGDNQMCKNGRCCTLPTSAPAGTCGNITNDCGSRWIGCPNGQDCVNGKCQNGCGNKCGTKLPNGLGGTMDCPCAGTGNTCSSTAPGVAGTCSCPAKTCADFAGQCGSFANGCGATINCGCTNPSETCGGSGKTNTCGCTKATCAGKCGIVDDKCGSTLNCGPC
jgi:hypothetical protein